MDSKGVLRYRDKLCVPNVQVLRRSILEEAHHATYTVHLRINKMYQDLKHIYWWEGIKKDVAKFVSRCLVCQQMKVKHQKLVRLYQSLEVLKWK